MVMKKIMQICVLLGCMLCMVENQCCLKFGGWKCVQCPEGTRLYRGHCLFNIPNCLSYQDGFQCKQCEANYKLDQNGECIEDFPEKKDQIMIDIKNPTGTEGTGFTLANELLMSLHENIRESKTLAAMQKINKNGTKYLIINYETTEAFFEGVVEVNIQTFIFKEISFERVDAPTLEIPKKKQKQPVQKKSQIQQIQEISQKQEKKQVAQESDNVINERKFKKIEKSEAAKEIGYGIMRDFLNRVNEKYKKMKQTSIEVQKSDDVTWYRVVLEKDAQKWQIKTCIDLKTYTVEILEQKPLHTLQPVKFERVQDDSIFKDINFILVRNQIEKEKKSKFKDASISSVFKKETENKIDYKIVFELSDSWWEVEVGIQPKTFTYSEIKSKKLNSKEKVDEQEIVKEQQEKKNAMLAANQSSKEPPKTENSKPQINSLNEPETKPVDKSKEPQPQPQPEPEPQPQPQPQPQPEPQPQPQPAQLSPLIMNNVNGFQQLTKQQIADEPFFPQINTLVRDINEIPQSAPLLGLFVINKGFTRVYKIYYQVDSNIIQVHVTYDFLRRRTFILSSSILGY